MGLCFSCFYMNWYVIFFVIVFSWRFVVFRALIGPILWACYSWPVLLVYYFLKMVLHYMLRIVSGSVNDDCAYFNDDCSYFLYPKRDEQSASCKVLVCYFWPVLLVDYFLKMVSHYMLRIVNGSVNDDCTYFFYSERDEQSASCKEESAALKEEDFGKVGSFFNLFLDNYGGTDTSRDGSSESSDSGSDWFSVVCESVSAPDKD